MDLCFFPPLWLALDFLPLPLWLCHAHQPLLVLHRRKHTVMAALRCYFPTLVRTLRGITSRAFLPHTCTNQALSFPYHFHSIQAAVVHPLQVLPTQ